MHVPRYPQKSRHPSKERRTFEDSSDSITRRCARNISAGRTPVKNNPDCQDPAFSAILSLKITCLFSRVTIRLRSPQVIPNNLHPHAPHR